MSEPERVRCPDRNKCVRFCPQFNCDKSAAIHLDLCPETKVSEHARRTAKLFEECKGEGDGV